MISKYDYKKYELEKKMNELKKELKMEIEEIDSRLSRQIKHNDQSFKIFREILLRVYKERGELERDRDVMIEKYKDVIRKIPLNDKKMIEINTDVVENVRDSIKGNFEFIRDAARNSFSDGKIKKTVRKKDKITEDKISLKREKIHVKVKPSIDNLFEIIVKNGTMSSRNAAKIMGVHEAQINEWGKTLHKNDLVNIGKNKDKTEFSKKW